MTANKYDGLSIPQYMHQPVDSQKTQIRLLQIIDTDSDNISTVLSTFNLEECPPYTALSYTWGAPRVTQTILIDGCTFTIRQNLWEFLNSIPHVRKRVLTSERNGTENVDLHGTFFWIDQICIQQSSHVERSHQVGMMGQIFTRAREVFVWLGRWTSRPNAKFPEDGVMIGELCQRPYWHRLWVIQEIMVARSVAIVLGDALIDWDCFFRFSIGIPLGTDEVPGIISNVPDGIRVHDRNSLGRSDSNLPGGIRIQKLGVVDNLDSTRWLSQSFPADPQVSTQMRLREALHSINPAHGTLPLSLGKPLAGQRIRKESFDRLDFARHKFYSPLEDLPKIVQSIYNERELFRTKGQGNSLSYVLELFSFQGSECENPRDKVYGLLGLIKQNVAIEVDYQRSVNDVYRDVLSKIIHEESYLTGEKILEFSQLLKTSMALHDLQDVEIKDFVVKEKEKEEADWDTFLDASFQTVKNRVGQALHQFCLKDGNLDPTIEYAIEDCLTKLQWAYKTSRTQIFRTGYRQEPRQKLERLVKSQCNVEKRKLKTLALSILYKELIALLEPHSSSLIIWRRLLKLSKPASEAIGKHATRELQKLREKLEQRGVTRLSSSTLERNYAQREHRSRTSDESLDKLNRRRMERDAERYPSYESRDD